MKHVTNSSLKIVVGRSGSIDEVHSFLTSLGSCYYNLYVLGRLRLIQSAFAKVANSVDVNFLFENESVFPVESNLGRWQIIGSHRLAVAKISVNSPGFWEFVGSLSPLNVIREFLKDRHERRKDLEWREASELQRVTLENELLQIKVIDSTNEAIQSRIDILKSLNVTDSEIREILWKNVAQPLQILGKHQEEGLIINAE